MTKSKQTVWISIAFIWFVFAHSCLAQPIYMPKSEINFKVITTKKRFNAVCRLDSNQRMINLRDIIPGILLDIRYASINNFMHQIMYPENLNYTFLRLPVVRRLALVQNYLNDRGYGLKIFDAYRPYSVTKKFWNLVHDERYVANPSKGSGHNKGTTIDLTIIDLKTKTELPMGTDFDNFTDSAHHSFTNLPEKILLNRKFLKETMENYGFRSLETEWWHYSWSDNSNYDILDLSFKDLNKIRKTYPNL